MNIFHIFIFLQFQNKDVRPPFTYAALIKQVRSQSTDTAILQRENQLLLFSTLSVNSSETEVVVAVSAISSSK